VPAPGNRRLSAVDVPALLMAVHQGDSADIALRFGTCREVVRRLVDASAGLDERDLARLLARRERASFRQACQVLDGTWGGGEAAAALVQWRVGGMHLSQRQWPPALLPGLLGLVARLAGDWNGRLALQLCLHRWPQAPGTMAQARTKALAAMDAAGCPGRVIDGAGPVPGRATAFWQGCVLTVQLQDSAGGRTVCRDACAALVAAGCLVHASATCRT